ncbi:MAG: hypothetical protein HKN45_05810 [Flavobacteriales bacterium]|nr:hypothetical protein [Flavobacteriales bacterium]
MTNHLEYKDSDFEKLFETAQLDPSLFSHEAHLRLAWIHVTKYGVETACSNLRKQLQAYVTRLGESDKYNDTVTLACTQAVDHFVNRSKSRNFSDFIEEFPILKTNMKELLEQHYSIDIFKSETARKNYVSPDLQDFDQPIH